MTENAFQKANSTPLEGGFIQRTGSGTMAVSGAVNKTFILATIMLATAALAYSMKNPLLMFGGAIGGFIVVLIQSIDHSGNRPL